MECAASSKSFFQQLQMSLMLEYKLRVVPLGTPQEAAKIITQMVLVLCTQHAYTACHFSGVFCTLVLKQLS